MISPKSLHSVPIRFNIPFQRAYLCKHSQPFPTLEIKCLIQGHSFQEGRKARRSYIFPVLISQVTHQAQTHLSHVEATTAPCCSSWQSLVQFVLVFRAHESCMPWIFWSMTVHILQAAVFQLIKYSRWFLCQCWWRKVFGISLLIELREVFLEQGEFWAW